MRVLYSPSQGKNDSSSPQIEGMTCSSCVHMIERTLNGVTGVEKAVVTLATNSGRVEFDPAVLGARDIIRIIEVREFLVQEWLIWSEVCMSVNRHCFLFLLLFTLRLFLSRVLGSLLR